MTDSARLKEKELRELLEVEKLEELRELDVPAAVPQLRTWNDWRELHDAKSGNTYWYNTNDTTKVQWNHPSGMSQTDVASSTSTAALSDVMVQERHLPGWKWLLQRSFEASFPTPAMYASRYHGGGWSLTMADMQDHAEDASGFTYELTSHVIEIKATRTQAHQPRQPTAKAAQDILQAANTAPQQPEGNRFIVRLRDLDPLGWDSRWAVNVFVTNVSSCRHQTEYKIAARLSADQPEASPHFGTACMMHVPVCALCVPCTLEYTRLLSLRGTRWRHARTLASRACMKHDSAIPFCHLRLSTPLHALLSSCMLVTLNFRLRSLSTPPSLSSACSLCQSLAATTSLATWRLTHGRGFQACGANQPTTNGCRPPKKKPCQLQ